MENKYSPAVTMCFALVSLWLFGIKIELPKKKKKKKNSVDAPNRGGN